MNVASIKEVFAAMKEAGVLYFKHVEASGESVKIVMKGEQGEVEQTDARGTEMGFSQPDEPEGADSIYQNRTLKFRGFTNE